MACMNPWILNRGKGMQKILSHNICENASTISTRALECYETYLSISLFICKVNKSMPGFTNL